jgi:hypothetical protein
MVVSLKPIKPRKIANADKMEAAVTKALASTLQQGIGLFKRTTKGWRTVDVVFYVDGPNNGRGAVGTDNQIYDYVTRGTRPHLIKPKKGKFLVFGEGKYKSVTRPGVLGARNVGTRLVPKGGVARPIFARSVKHPGTKARGFEELVAARLEPVLITKVTAAILSAME